jgi:hypothetical protein
LKVCLILAVVILALDQLAQSFQWRDARRFVAVGNGKNFTCA